ncbi:MAG: glycosyltransferase [Clostridium beijerinckii]|jgi:glycosyltransferase involved in cell wall biosynthesis|uniref:glycosyltransferase n=1 Tax=Clostridium beijerinckii TaxID=1520 RepID=UPI001494A1B7|nr:glycosyltransferase [Clostridium beijerinckii]MCI1477715.1 glycosyltransferase [Clostridium beijerinckii]MCI1577969.1 glycosyltransferase [Clostridium beijerinckii]MCI1583691.1 glycosyltransferase [Clostridium beijerinckii]MCI1620620.1 glycosyltransferase [Clostridium beijerinckii]NOW87857.1 glycosyltransferase involved in cell wall biosynthesis [Clostridium beijerinckii]
MGAKLVSVIMPTYNNSVYIEEALNSLFYQTYTNIEIIVVDDGSTDNTNEVLEKYLDKIKYIRKINEGVSSARNLGIDLSKGDYIAFLDSDDLYSRDKIEKQVEMLEQFKDIDIVYNDIDIINENGEYISTLESEGVYTNKNNFLCMMLVRQIIPGPASMMIRRKCLEDGIRYNERYSNAEDYDFTLKIALRYKYGYLNKSLYMYRRHSSNLTNNHKKQLQSERSIINSLGLDKIKLIVNSSTFSDLDKKLILSKILIKLELWENAKGALEETGTDNSNKLIYFYLGNCNYHLKKYNQAKINYLKAITIDNSMAEAHNNLGCIYVLLGNIKKAKLEFLEAINLRSNYIDAKINLQMLNDCCSLSLKITNIELRKELTSY